MKYPLIAFSLSLPFLAAVLWLMAYEAQISFWEFIRRMFGPAVLS